jgi:hypothetical protein
MPTPKTNTWRRATRRKAANAGPPGYGTGGWNGGPSFVDAFRTRRAPNPAELLEAYKQIVFACSHLNQNGVARTRLGLYVSTGQGQTRPKSHSCPTRPVRPAVKAMLRASGGVSRAAQYHQKMAASAEVDEVTEHPLLEMLNSVNDDWDYDSWVRYTVGIADVVGWFFHLPEAAATVRGKPVPDTLWPLLAQYVLPVRYPSGSLVEKYTYFGQEYLPRDLIRGRFVSLRDPYGLGYGPTQAAFAYVGLSDQFASLQESLFTQGGKISGILTDADSLNPLGKPEGERAEREINASWSRGNAGKVKYLPANLKFTPTSWPPADLAALDVSDNALKMVSLCFGVPLSLIKQEDMSLASAEAGHRQHGELAVDPRCTMIASALTKWTRGHGKAHGLPGWDRLYWAFDNPVAEDEERQAKIVDMGLKNGSLVINQVNQNKGLPDVPWGDEPWLPNTLSQPSKRAEPADPAAAGDPEDDPEDPAAKSLEGDDRRPFPLKMVDRGADSGGPDDDEGGEKNTFNLPAGADIRRELIRWVGRQAREVLGEASTVGVSMLDAFRFRSLGLWDEPMATAMTPLISAYWDQSGKRTMERLGLDPADWRVTSPHLEGKIRRAAYDFCHSTNASTTRRLDHALADLREQFVRGQVTDGETLPELTKRVNGVFDGLSKSRSRLIAATEASRAVHAAQETAATEFGDVAGFELLLSSDACDLCRKVYNECKRVRAGQPFAVIGDNPTYSAVMYPPLHPRCMCSMVHVFKPEDGGPADPQWGATLVQPQRTAARPQGGPGEKPEAAGPGTGPAPGPKRPPADPPASPGPRVSLETKGRVSPRFAEELAAAVGRYGPRVHEALAAAGCEIVGAGRFADVAPEAVNQTPRGWPEGATWANVDGGYDGTRKTAFACETYLDRYAGNAVRSSARYVGVLNHEVGHAFDSASGVLSADPEFVAAYNRDAASIGEHARPGLAYYFQAGHAGRHETFAEVFAQLHGAGAGADRMLELFPAVAEFLRSRV